MSDFTIDCPGCGSTVGVNLEDVAKQRIKYCPHGHAIQLEDDGGNVKKVTDFLDKF